MRYISVFATVLLLFGFTTAYAQEGWIEPAPADDIGLVGDDDYQSEALDFGFPFNAMNYNSVMINTNGGIVLGNDGTYDVGNQGYVDYDIYDLGYFESDFLDVGEPIILGFESDLDTSEVGTIYLTQDVNSATITWEDVAAHEDDTFPFATFQITLYADGRIAIRNRGLDSTDLTTDLYPGIVVGVSAGLTTTNPGKSDLSAGVNADATVPYVYEVWCLDETAPDAINGYCVDQTDTTDNNGFDLEGRTVTFTPNGTGGFDLTAASGGGGGDTGGGNSGDSGIVGDTDNILGCTLGSNGRPDPTFPLLLIASLAYLTRRKWMRVQ